MQHSQDTSEQKSLRLVETAVAVLLGGEGGLKIVALQKALFFADLIALRDFGETLTRNTYVALQQGPVIAKCQKRLVRELADRGLADQVLDGMARPLRLTRAGREYERRVLSDREWQVAKKLGSLFAGETSAFASSFSHDNPGWIAAYEQGVRATGVPLPIDMLLALQAEARAPTADLRPAASRPPAPSTRPPSPRSASRPRRSCRSAPAACARRRA